jgi:hypothetical protein
MKVAIALLCVNMIMSTSLAGVVYTNGDPLADPGTHYSKSDTVSSSQFVADNFRLSSPTTVNSIRWWGAWNFFSPAVDDFTITIYENLNGLPNPSNIVAIRQTGNVSETSTGLTRSGFTLFSFQANVGAISLSNGRDYWISIVETLGTNTSQYFLWRENANGSSATSTNNGASWASRPREYAFQLEGFTNAVPEPSTTTLLVIAAGLCVTRRRYLLSRK